MGRLIDADAFEKFIKEKYKDGENTDDIKDQMLFDLSYQPTAYDVDAVVKELVEMRNKDSQGCKDVGKKCLSYTDCGLCIMDRAIDIVRGEAE
jgi:hypothetical protein